METLTRKERPYQCCFRSYRTYEEWKLDLCQELCVTRFRSYRTYEEWKHRIRLRALYDHTRFLPYL